MREEAWRAVEAALSLESYVHIKDASAYSDERLRLIRQVISSSEFAPALLARDIGYLAVGSLGRMEATSGESDLDLIMVAPTSSTAIDEELLVVDRALRAHIHDVVGIHVSEGKNLTGPAVLDEVAAASMIGGSNDDVNKLTKRALILLESRSVFNSATTDALWLGVFRAYAAAERTVGKRLHSLGNDIGRYYRTVCVDYKSRVDFDRKPWAYRKIKLRHRRHLLFFSSMLSIVSSTQ
jgi:hypothetical protein